jgi:GNAT superfamily N-acetyltransferase
MTKNAMTKNAMTKTAMTKTAMTKNGDERVREARLEDAAAVEALVNAAFAVEKGRFKEMERLDRAETLAHFASGKFLLAEDAAGALVACVYVSRKEDVGYFGMLSVDPARQRTGLGRRMAAEAEQWCRARGCSAMELVVVDLRTELPPIYERLGYRAVGLEEAPHPERFTVPVKFLRMRKDL